MARDEHTLFPIHLPPHIRVQQARASVKSKSVERITEDGGGFPNFRKLIESTERQYFQKLMSSTDGNIKAVCRISGLSRGHIYRLLKKYNITRHV